MNPKKYLHITTFTIQQPYIAGHSLNSVSEVLSLLLKSILFPYIESHKSLEWDEVEDSRL